MSISTKAVFDELERHPIPVALTLAVSYPLVIWLLFGPVFAFMESLGRDSVAIIYVFLCFAFLYLCFFLVARFLAVSFGFRLERLEALYSRFRRLLGDG